jgi:glucokinase
MINTFNPEMVVIGGGLSKAGDLIFTPLRESLPSYTLPAILDEVTIRPSSLNMNTGIYGAAALVFYEQERDTGTV